MAHAGFGEGSQGGCGVPGGVAHCQSLGLLRRGAPAASSGVAGEGSRGVCEGLCGTPGVLQPLSCRTGRGRSVRDTKCVPFMCALRARPPRAARAEARGSCSGLPAAHGVWPRPPRDEQGLGGSIPRPGPWGALGGPGLAGDPPPHPVRPFGASLCFYPQIILSLPSSAAGALSLVRCPSVLGIGAFTGALSPVVWGFAAGRVAVLPWGTAQAAQGLSVNRICPAAGRC